MKLERILIGLTVAVAVFGATAALFAPRAHASVTYDPAGQLPTPTGSNEVFMGWRAQSGTVCFSYPDNGSLKPLVSTAVNAWDKSQARVIRRNDCAASGFAASETVRMAFASGTKDGRDPASWCAITSAGGFSAYVPRVDAGPVYVTYKLTGLVTIWINQDLVRGCRADTAAWQHLITHELGHRIGLGHNAGGPMTDRSGLPNADNIAEVNLLY